MARIMVVHTFFDILGGGEYLALNLAEALSREHKVTIYTVTRPSRKRIRNLFGIDIGRFRIVVRDECNFLKDTRGKLVRLRRIVSYRRLFKALPRILEEDPHDFIIDTQSNMPTPVDLAYIHFPIVAKAFSGTPKGAYDWLVKFLYRRWFGKSRSGRIVCNSSFTARAVYKYYHVIPDIIHPPVDTGYFFSRETGPRKKIILTVSRFTDEKRLPDLAKATRQIGFRHVFIGSTASGSRAVIEKIERAGVHTETYPDMPRSELRGLMHEAMIYIHPPFQEHFGISVVEAMAAGLVPIVYRESGTCIDVVSLLDPSLCYDSISDIPKIVEYIEKNYEELSLRARAIARFFDKKIFCDRILEYVNELLERLGLQ